MEGPFSCCRGELYVDGELAAVTHDSTEQTTGSRASKPGQHSLSSIIPSAICSCSCLGNIIHVTKGQIEQKLGKLM